MSKKILLRWGFLCLLCVFAIVAGAQTTTVTWPMSDALTADGSGELSTDDGQPVSNIAYSGSITEGLTASVELGSNLYWYRSKNYSDWFDKDFLEVTPWAKIATDDVDYESNGVMFNLNIEEGYKFTPTKISCYIMRDGTNYLYVDTKLVCDDVETDLETGVKPNRAGVGNSTECTVLEYEWHDVTAATEKCGFWLNLRDFDLGKSAGIADVVIEGNLQSTEDTSISYHVTYSPANGETLDESLSVISITANGPIALGGTASDIVVYKDGSSTPVATGSKISGYNTDDNGTTIGVNVTLDNTIDASATGSYYYVVPAGFLTYTGTDMDGNTGNAATTINFSISSDKCIYSTDFTDWYDIPYSAGEEYKVKTDYTSETITFSLFGVQVKPDDDKFEDIASIGYLETAKTSELLNNGIEDGSPYVETSEINSITRIKFTQAATGNNRGVKISVKGVQENGTKDTDWVTVFDTYINEAPNYQNPSGGKLDSEEIEVNRTRCKILIESLTATENAYLTDLKIYADIDKEIEYPYTFTSDPEDGATVESISTISVQTSEGVIMLNGLSYNTSDVKVYSVDALAKDEVSTEPVASGESRVAISDNDGNTIGYTFTLDKTIDEVGAYRVIIPAGMFYCGSSTNLSDEINISLLIAENAQITFDPADGSQIEQLDTITVSCESGINYNWQGVKVYQISEDGTETELVEITVDAEDQYLTSDWDEVCVSTVVTFTPAITETGTYSVVFPEASFVYGTSQANSEEITLTYDVLGGNGISALLMDAVGGDNKFYNLNGQRVSTPHNGVFITNGKKILVK